MADSSILELAAEAASSTLFIFCFFNLITLIVLFTSRPVFSSFDRQNDDDDDDIMPLSIVIQSHSNTNTEQNYFMLQKNATVDVCEVIKTQIEPDRCMNNFNCSDNVEESDDDHEDEDEDDFRRKVEEFIEKVNSVEEDEDEDDFRRKVEEFIEKVNKGWREERQRTSRSVE